MVYADLHVHTQRSDGTLTLDEVPAAAREAGVSAVAVTDHDRLHPALDAPVTERDGVEVVAGIELRVDAGDQRLDLLGYGVTPTEELRAETERIQRDRVARGRAIIENVEAELGVSLALEPREGLGRPHVARAVVAHPDTDYDAPDAVFADLIGNDGPCFVARDVPDFAFGADLLADACGVVGLAHPLRYPDPEAALARCESLDAVELHYPYDRPVGRDADDGGRALVEAAIEEYDLLPAGGSDAHGRELGKDGLDEAAYADLRARL
ncbi:PHP domain-containing protein [Halobacterium sp. CBA1126]|uniref:PHP domain-containing protein n=1 Tax=Halobacterium sp. CBA1126 TaxID=2668074 RepID=UPI0012F79511|nr:PHP domain-containing protein [Halobacterium sp. CBA1126]MUV60122.1 PHP domain-containing protein [Halobacterium sp. CBA1126]